LKRAGKAAGIGKMKIELEILVPNQNEETSCEI
jgi:hypothetical protein